MDKWKVPLADVDLNEEEIEAVTDVLHSGWLSMGPVTGEFERQFAEWIGVKHAFAVTNCTAALHLAHVALGAGQGDKVICPSLTFVATANAIRYTGATPVFADITGVDDLNISPDAIEARIDQLLVDQSLKGICVVHYGGYPCNMEKIMGIARQHNLYIVEDAAHAPGAGVLIGGSGRESLGKIIQKCGTIGDIGCFSFFANKNMVTAEGGMITTNNDSLAAQIKLLRSHGMTSLTWDREQGHSFSYDVVALGYNYRIDELRSAIGLAQLGKLMKNNQNRERLTRLYRERLVNIQKISIPFLGDKNISSHHLFPILLSNRSERENFMQAMRDKGVQTSIHYPALHKFSYYDKTDDHHSYEDSLSTTEDVAARVVTLPLYPTMTGSQVDYVVEAVRNALS